MPCSGSRTGMSRPGGRSAAVATATTPGAPAASRTPTECSRPCATGERTTRAQHCPLALKSSPNRPRPRSSRGSSLRAARVPTDVMARPPTSAASLATAEPRPRCRQHRVDDPLVAGAPAGVRRGELADFRLGRLASAGRLPLGEIGLGQHQEARRAETALQPVVIAERLLQIGQLLAVGQALDRTHVASVRLHPEHQAGPDRGGVHEHRGRAADAVLTAEVGAGVAEVVAQHVRQRPAGFDGELVLGAVDPEPDLPDVLHAAPLRCSPLTALAALAPPIPPGPPGSPAATASPASAAQTSAGSTGTWSNEIPAGRSASLIALSTAAGAPIMPPSPMPLAPVSLNCDAVSRCVIWTGHSSAAVGAR